MSQQRATDQGAATTSSNNNSDVITLGDVDEDGDVIFVGIVRPTVTTVDLCLSPSTSAAAAAAARSGNGSADEPDAEPGLGSRATASASNPILPASSPEDAAKPGTVDAATTISDGDSFSATAVALECPICLQTCIHPARLPCGHIFCFLCVKGVAYKNPRCAMCRREIHAEFLDHPQLVNGIEDICTTRATEDGYQWYYEGRNGGWWAYDSRTNGDIEIGYADYKISLEAKSPQPELAVLDSTPNSRAIPPKTVDPTLDPLIASVNPTPDPNPIDLTALAESTPDAAIDPPFIDPNNDNDFQSTNDENEDRYSDVSLTFDSDSECLYHYDDPDRLHLQICGRTYVIDFIQMKQYALSTRDKQRNIMRCSNTIGSIDCFSESHTRSQSNRSYGLS
uniref:E3 ubiquitin-protein ligase n=1 Tax=Drosophila rhopaloa TaxID=1041015 RepID=A0A6P4F0H9_DRORH